MQFVRAALIAVLVVFVCGSAARAQTECARGDFESAVDEAAAQLIDMNQSNTPQFQAKLRQLKERRGWNQSQFMSEAATFVRDDRIAAYDEKSENLLQRINNLGQEGTASAAPDCKLLGEVRKTMGALVEAQTAKWTYMFDKIGQELRR